MALADYYARNALAAAQVLAGFDEQRIREVLQNVRVGVLIGTDAAHSPEGQALLDLLIRLLARLYPNLVISGEKGSQVAIDDAMELASLINPAITFGCDPTVVIVVGAPAATPGNCPSIFVGCDGWNGSVGTERPWKVGSSDNPFGAGIAACLSAANLFRLIFQAEVAKLDESATFSALGGEPRQSGDVNLGGVIGEIVQVGVGAIGNASAWALARVPMDGVVHLVDHETVDLGILQRYVLAARSDENSSKVEVASRSFTKQLTARSHLMNFEDFVSSAGHSWPQMILGLDNARDRRAAQASLPKWIANAWTQPGDLGVATHDFLEGACVACLYLPEHALESDDAIVADALGVRDQLIQIRALLYNGAGTPRELLDAIAASRSIAIERLLPFEGRPIRTLYSEGFCGGAVISIGEIGAPRQDVHVPLAHQSALAGVLLAAAAVRQALKCNRAGTNVTRIDVMQPLGSFLTQPAAKDSRGICICQDFDYREVYRDKYLKPLT